MRLSNWRRPLQKGGIAFEQAHLIDEKKKLEEELNHPDIWNDHERAGSITKRIKKIKGTVEPWSQVKREVEDLYELYVMALNENEEELEPDIQKGIEELKKRTENLERLSLFTGESDPSNTYLTNSHRIPNPKNDSSKKRAQPLPWIIPISARSMRSVRPKMNCFS